MQKKNSLKKSNRHDNSVKKFSLALLILAGNSGYELLQKNLKDALPAYSTLQKLMSTKKRMVEGTFYFTEFLAHLNEWKAPKFVHVQLDDTRIINEVSYDAYTDRFVGFILPLKNGLPVEDTFVLNTFAEIEDAYVKNKSSVAKYAHCIVVQSIAVEVPSFVLAVIGTDSKYDNTVVSKRWEHIDNELKKLGIVVISNGSDGAGPFLKSMLTETKLFNISTNSNVPTSWSFFVMPSMKKSSLCAQDHVHLLAKLRSRLLGPSNLIVLGAETACSGHLTHVCQNIPKESHGLTKKVLDNKDKQNYSSISILVSDDLKKCLFESKNIIRPTGTIIYLQLMRNIRDAFFEKGIKPIQRVSLLWKVVFFVRIWRCWLSENGYSEIDHFITTNAYTCIELNGHLLLNILFNVINGTFPKEVLRLWLTGSQSCEQLFRLLRSMTPVFSTIVNFSLKRLLERIHRLSHISSLECTEDVIFPRLQRRLLHLNEETKDTFEVPTLSDIETAIRASKTDAISLASECSMQLDNFEDSYLVKDTTELVSNAIEYDFEEKEITLHEEEPTETAENNCIDSTTSIEINEDLAILKLSHHFHHT